MMALSLDLTFSIEEVAIASEQTVIVAGSPQWNMAQLIIQFWSINYIKDYTTILYKAP